MDESTQSTATAPHPREPTSKPSDQLPEEAPPEQVSDDVPEAGEGAARETGRRHAREARTHPDSGQGGKEPDDVRSNHAGRRNADAEQR